MAKDKTKYVGERYESKHGKYEIIEYIGGSHSKVKVKFDDILNGEVQDPSFKNKYHARNNIGSQEMINSERVLKKYGTI